MLTLMQHRQAKPPTSRQMTNTAPHPFEAAGLGSPPFVVIDYYRRRNGRESCECCGRKIEYVFVIRSASGRTSSVGSSCVKRCGGEPWASAESIQRHYASAEKRNDPSILEKIADGMAATMEANAARDWLVRASHGPESRPLLLASPHPFAFYAKQGLTLADYVDFVLANSHRSDSIVDAYRRIPSELQAAVKAAQEDAMWDQKKHSNGDNP